MKVKAAIAIEKGKSLIIDHVDFHSNILNFGKSQKGLGS
jgi:hypothetical protein